MRYFASRNYQRFFVEREVEETSRMQKKEQQNDKEDDDDDDDDVGDSEATLKRKEQRREPEKGWREEGSERGIAERRVRSFVCAALEREGAKGMKVEGEKEN